MASNSECSICFQNYDEKDRRPLVLPCSHSFCQTCLGKLEASGNPFCSHCRESWSHTKVKDLLCCYQLISSGGSNQPKNSHEKCSDHDADVSMWCESCSQGICVKCLRLTHKECNWVLVEEMDEKHQATYNKAVSDLAEKMSENFVTLTSMDNLMHKVLCCRDELIDWQNKAEQQLASCPTKTGQVKLQAAELQRKCNTLLAMRQFSPSSDKSSSLLFLIAKAFQESSDGKLESFMTKLRTTPDPFLVSKEDEKSETSKQLHPQVPSAPPVSESDNKLARPADRNDAWRRLLLPPLKEVVAVPAFQNTPTFQDGRLWTIKDNGSLQAANKALRSNMVTPSCVNIEGLHLDKSEMSTFIALVSKISCRLSLRVLNPFLRPSPRVRSCGSISRDFPSLTIMTTRYTLLPLLKSETRCTLTEFWGHLDEDCAKQLPQTCRNVGLALIDKEDMATVNMLVEADAGKWISKNDCSSLKEINLSIVRSFSASYWKLQKKNRGFFGSSASTCGLPSGSLTIGLHFPKLEAGWSDVAWLKEILQKIAGQISYEGILRNVYLPDTKVSPESLQSVLTTFGLAVFTNIFPVTVHFASSLSGPNSNGLHKIGKCLFQWDMDNNSYPPANLGNWVSSQAGPREGYFI